MSRNICIVQDFLTVSHRMQIREAAAAVDFVPHFFTTREQEAAKACLQECEVLYAASVDLLRAAPATLRWYACSFAGVDPYCQDPSLFANPDCILTNSNVYGGTIAEHLVMVSLMLLRRMADYVEPLRRREWPSSPPVRSIRGGSFTILGTGDIGSRTAERFRALGAAKITGVNRSGRRAEAFDEVVPVSRLDEILPKTSFLIMAVPGTAETTRLLDRRRIALLPREAYVVNVGRGSAIDQEALCEALNAGRIAGAALDVTTPEPLPPDNPLWEAKNLILTPHVSGNLVLDATCDENVRLFCENLRRYGAGEPLRGVVDRSRGY